MFQSSYQGTETLVNRSMRVLLCIANTRDRELLADQLRSADLSVVTPAATDSMPQFDLCVADTTTFPKVAETIEARRGQLGAVQLPVLLVLGPNDSEQSARAYWDRIDDVLAVPTSKDVFRHRVETLLETRRQSEQLALFARAMDDAHTGISIATAEGDRELLYINDAFEEITGYDREEVVGRNCRFLQGPETEARTVDRLRRAIEAERPVSVEIRNYRKDGEMFWNALEIAPVHGEDRVTHFVGFQQDVTERVERTQLLQRYEEIVTAAGDPIYALDRDLRFTLSNGATGAFTEQTAAEIRGSHVSTVFGENHAEVLGAAVLDLADSDTQQRSIGTVAEDTEGRPRRLQTTVAARPTEAENAPVNGISTCVKGKFGYDFINSDDRLTKPLVRDEHGEFREASWDEALSRVATGLGEIRDQYGGEALSVIASSKATNEENYLMGKFARQVLGTNSVDNCNRLCHSSTVAGLAKTFGYGAASISTDDLEIADCILLTGSNTTEAHPVLATRIKQNVRDGADLLVFDPREIQIAEHATQYSRV